MKPTQAGSIALIHSGHGRPIGIQRVKLFELTRSNPATAITPRVRRALMIQMQAEWSLIISQGDKKLDSAASPSPMKVQGDASRPAKYTKSLGSTDVGSLPCSLPWAYCSGAGGGAFICESTPPEFLIRFVVGKARGWLVRTHSFKVQCSQITIYFLL